MKILTSSSIRLGDCRTAFRSIKAVRWSIYLSVKLTTRLTGSNIHGFHIVIGNIVFDPLPVQVALPFSFGIRMQPFSNHAVAEQTGRQCDLESKPVLRLPYVENVSAAS